MSSMLTCSASRLIRCQTGIFPAAASSGDRSRSKGHQPGYDGLEIRFPRVEGSRVELPGRAPHG